MDIEQTAAPLHTTLALDGLAGSIAAARTHARAFLAECRHPPLTQATATDALVLISELVTNAVRHSPGPCALGLVYDGDALVIAVSDTGPDLPRRRPGDLITGAGGFGWNVLTSLTKDIRITGHVGGWKTIVALLPVQPA
ncbi:ATP-binding protein [Kitasatospora mediocidica]|uniref:ATP-binding protein n=1 Tax=Kitasatospora mediocidica TaxID=58352 RepID=UPI000691146E|nr:ATP-binding protein [Kitasatospora mediocidica]